MRMRALVAASAVLAVGAMTTGGGVAAASALKPAIRAGRSTTAAAPSFGEQSIHSRSGGQTTRESSTWSRVTSDRNMASGLATPWRRFFTTTAARSSSVTPEVSMSRWARRAK